MRILMFGWEFPPHVSGGLGTACFGITRALTGLGHEITFVIPKVLGDGGQSHVKFISASEVPVKKRHRRELKIFKGLDVRLIDSYLKPYLSRTQYENLLRGRLVKLNAHEKVQSESWESIILKMSEHYGLNLIAEVVRYARAAGAIAESQSCDVIHAHDWMTVLAGLYAREVSKKPLVLHIHSLEFDRSGENINRDIFFIERYGMVAADRIIAVSHFTKNMIVSRYGIDPDKISVVHNAVSRTEAANIYHVGKSTDRKTVLFLGRITYQKGPDYFIEAAAKVLQRFPEVTFVMAGAGDMLPQMIERVAELGIGKNFHFTGFLHGTEVEQIFAMSDLYVMPSISEPFGISPLEAMIYDVPVIISRQSGVAEILHHALKVDFWDVDEIANKIIAVLRYPPLVAEMIDKTRDELRSIRWEYAAEKIVEAYRQVLR